MITIIIPTIGRSDTIEEAVTSAIACDQQVVKEILIADNSQDDKFAEMLRGFEKLDDRVKIISYEQHFGMAKSWNVATEDAREEWVLYLHDDDVLYAESITEAARCLNGTVGFVYCNCDIAEEGRILSWKYRHGDSLSRILSLCPRFVATIINRKALAEIGGWDEGSGYALDLVAFLTIAKRRPTVHCNRNLGLYRIHKGNSSTRSGRNREYGDYLGRVITKLFLEYKDEETRRKILALLVSFTFPIPKSTVYRLARRAARTMKAYLLLE